jgi:hypothetical protein
MMRLLPSPTLHLIERRTRIFVPALVEPSSPTGRIGRPRKLAHVVGKLAKSLLARGQGRFGALAFSNLLGNDVDADDTAVSLSQRMPISHPDTFCIFPIRSLAADFYAGNRLTGAQYCSHDLFDVVGNLGNRFPHRTPNMVGD